jgi:hypothetical protein
MGLDRDIERNADKTRVQPTVLRQARERRVKKRIRMQNLETVLRRLLFIRNRYVFFFL